MTLLGNIRVLGVSDSTAGYGFNTFLPGTGWDVLLSQTTAAQSAVCVSGTWPRQTEFEVFQTHLDGPVGSSVLLMINRQPFNHILQGWQNYNDPQQPWPIRDGDEIQFAWTTAFAAGPYTPSGGANVRPVITLWFQTPHGAVT